jgi:hypothetical protein
LLESERMFTYLDNDARSLRKIVGVLYEENNRSIVRVLFVESQLRFVCTQYKYNLM